MEKCIRDNFKDWGTRVDTVFVDDLNVRLELGRDIRLKREGLLRMGKVHFQTMRNKYAQPDQAMESFYAEDESEPIDPVIRDALSAWKAPRNPNSRPMLTYLKQVTEPSQRTVVAVMKAALDVAHTCSFSNVTVVVDIIRWAQKTRVNISYPIVFGNCKDHFDRMLARHLDYQHGEGVSMDEWWELNHDLARLVVDGAKFEACLQCKSAWTAVEEDLKALVLDSHLGRVAFEDCYMELVSERNTDLVEQSVKALEAGDLTEKRIAESRVKFGEAATVSGKDPI